MSYQAGARKLLMVQVVLAELVGLGRRSLAAPGLRQAGLAALIASSAACSGTWCARGATIAYAASSALVACDVGQTLWASDGGAWDRMSSRGNPIGELNPVLGHNPSPSLLAAIPVAYALVGYAIDRSSLPSWAKIAAFGGVTAAEAYTVAGNVARESSGACGVVGTRSHGVSAVGS